jgi:hypothetical protein
VNWQLNIREIMGFLANDEAVKPARFFAADDAPSPERLWRASGQPDGK